MVESAHVFKTRSLQIKQANVLYEAISKGDSIALIGLSGSGRTRLLDALYVGIRDKHPRFSRMFPDLICLVVDMRSLTEPTSTAFHRLFLRTLVEQSSLFGPGLQDVIKRHAEPALGLHEPDLLQVQSYARQILHGIRDAGKRLLLVMDWFDDACGPDANVVLNVLDGLRVGVGNALSFVIGTSVDLFEAVAIDGLRQSQQRLNIRCIWLGQLNSAETRALILDVAPKPVPEQRLCQLEKLCGGFPALAEAVTAWWSSDIKSLTVDSETEDIYQFAEVRNALLMLWDGLFYYERSILYDVMHVKPRHMTAFVKRHRRTLQSLVRRGILQGHISSLSLFSPLMALWLRDMRHTIRGNVWFNIVNDTYYQGERPLETLSPRAEAALDFFLQNPYKKCEKDMLIAHIWETPYVTDDSVYQVIRELRRSLEPDSKQPCYLLNHRSLRGGRYQFFPEGRSGSRLGE